MVVVDLQAQDVDTFAAMDAGDDGPQNRLRLRLGLTFVVVLEQWIIAIGEGDPLQGASEAQIVATREGGPTFPDHKAALSTKVQIGLVI